MRPKQIRDDGRVGIAAAKEATGVSEGRLWMAFAKGHIEAVRQNQRLYFLPADLERYRASLVLQKIADDQNAALQRRREAVRRCQAKENLRD